MANNNLQTQLTIRANVDGANEVNQLATSLDNVNNQLTQTTNPANATSQALDNLGNQAGQSVHQTNQLTQAIRSVNSGLSATTAPATNASNAINNLGNQMTQSAQSANHLGNAVNGVRSVAGGLQGLLAALGIGLGAKELLEMAEAFKSLEARVRLATGEGVGFVSAMEGIKEIASETNANIIDTGDLFNKLSTAGKALNLTQQETLQLTNTVNKAVQLSGASAESSANAIRQFTQAIDSGVLRGDELVSVMEQTPSLTKAIAEGLGVTISGLRQMGAEGKLTSEVVIGALQNQHDVIAEKYAKLPTTVGDAITGLKNELLVLVGSIDKEISTSQGITDFILGIKNELASIDPATVESLKFAFESLGEIAKTVWQSVENVAVAIAGVGQAGIETQDKLSAMTRVLQGVAVVVGAISDGVTALSITIQTAFGFIIKEIGKVYYAWQTLLGKPTETANKLIAEGQQLLDHAQKSVLEFESKTAGAIDNIFKSKSDRLHELATSARQKYESIANDGVSSAGKVEEAFIAYAKAHIKANNNIIDETLKQELAQKNLQAVVDNTGKIIIESTQTAKQAVDDTTQSLDKHADSLKKLNLDMGEFMGGLPTKAQEAMSAFDDLAKTGQLSNEQLARAYNATKQAIGDNKQAQSELNAKLLESVGGNQALANSILALADSQNKSATASKDNAKVSENSAKTKETAKVATDQHTQSVRQNSTVLTENTKAKADNTKASDDNAKTQSSAMAFGQALLAMINRQSEALKQTTNDMGLLSQAFEKIKSDVFRGGTYGFKHFGDKLNALNKEVKDNVRYFKEQQQAVETASQSLSKADVSTQDLARAQSVLNQATSFSIAGIIKLDKAKLDGLRQQIESTKQKLNDLADTARQTRQNLESELANLQGNEQKARQIEQEQKLKALEKQLKEAQKRNNTTEINELNQAIALQRQIYQEKERQIRLEQQKEKQREQQQSQTSTKIDTTGTMGASGTTGAVDLSQTAQELTGIWQERINEAEERGAVNFAKQLIAESKRRAN